MNPPLMTLTTLNSPRTTLDQLLVLVTERRERDVVSPLDKVPLAVSVCVDKRLVLDDQSDLDLRVDNNLCTDVFPSLLESLWDLDTRERSTILSSLTNLTMLPLDLPATVSILLLVYRVDFYTHFLSPHAFSSIPSTVESLFEANAVSKSKYPVHKIVTGKNEFTAKDITVQAHAFTKSARAAIEAAGGKCEILKPSTGAVIEA